MQDASVPVSTLHPPETTCDRTRTEARRHARLHAAHPEDWQMFDRFTMIHLQTQRQGQDQDRSVVITVAFHRRLCHLCFPQLGPARALLCSAQSERAPSQEVEPPPRLVCASLDCMDSGLWTAFTSEKEC